MMAKYSREQIDAAIDTAMQVFGLKILKYQQLKAVWEFVNGQDVFVSWLWEVLLLRSSTYTMLDSLRPYEEPSTMLYLSPYCSNNGIAK